MTPVSRRSTSRGSDVLGLTVGELGALALVRARVLELGLEPGLHGLVARAVEQTHALRQGEGQLVGLVLGGEVEPRPAVVGVGADVGHRAPYLAREEGVHLQAHEQAHHHPQAQLVVGRAVGQARQHPALQLGVARPAQAVFEEHVCGRDQEVVVGDEQLDLVRLGPHEVLDGFVLGLVAQPVGKVADARPGDGRRCRLHVALLGWDVPSAIKVSLS